ncbi:protein phosphatase 2C domain-containing protein [Yoonia sp. F2084L]|uniref:PP2C family protein-serine/threonine phosphatase n=1 Tax=Yoonia sp. F2084L TaxID=2926419 RepID=UPI001FF605E5|nr:PP2C family serine/threonine-protein phosphatase [Yoonia sp. F2084L]MCK0094130.1 protein phosphatase 2C domain-containing protein [Yoonia sp. F2084L]
MTSGFFPHSLRFSGAGYTHTGRVRTRNEDAILLDPSGQLWVVADGMGGHGQGDVAAAMVVDGLATLADGDEPEAILAAQIQHINADIYALATQNGSTMGATLVAAFLQDGVSYLAWVGDSRIYLWRDGALRQLSHDHSRVQELMDQGLIGEAEARNHPDRHVITRAMGVAPAVDADFATLPLRADDRIMLCSDGLTTCVTDTAIADILGGTHGDPQTTAAALVRAALDAGAPDNVSVIVIAATED